MGVLFIRALTGGGGVVRGVAVTLIYIITIKTRGEVVVGVSGEFSLVREGGLELGRTPFI